MKNKKNITPSVSGPNPDEVAPILQQMLTESNVKNRPEVVTFLKTGCARLEGSRQNKGQVSVEIQSQINES